MNFIMTINELDKKSVHHRNFFSESLFPWRSWIVISKILFWVFSSNLQFLLILGKRRLKECLAMCLILGKTDAGVLINMLLLKRNYDELTAISATKLTTIMMIWTMSRMHRMMTSDQVEKIKLLCKLEWV